MLFLLRITPDVPSHKVALLTSVFCFGVFSNDVIAGCRSTTRRRSSHLRSAVSFVDFGHVVGSCLAHYVLAFVFVCGDVFVPFVWIFDL